MYHRVLLISEHDPWLYPNPMADKTHQALEEMGCTVKRLAPEKCDGEQFNDVMKQFQPDLIFGSIHDADNCAKIGGFLRESKQAPALNWWTEDPNSNHDRVIEASKSFDLWLTINLQGVPFWPTKCGFAAYAYDDTLYRPLNVPQPYDVSYIGQLGHRLSYEMLMPYMKILASRGPKALLCLERPIDVPMLPKLIDIFLRSRKLRKFWQSLPVWSYTWKTPWDPVEKNLFINQSKIHYTPNRVRGFWEESLRQKWPDYPRNVNGAFYQTKGRLFEGIGAGVMVLTDQFPGVEQLFEVGKELVGYRCEDLEDFKEKLDWYLQHDSERDRIARAGHERGVREHTLTCRVRQIMQMAEKLI